MERKFNELYADIVRILRRDYAGCGEYGDRFDPRYYNQAIGQAWHDDVLDELCFYRYVRQMLGCIGDAHLQLELTAESGYVPEDCGFRVRRCGDSLYVTSADAEKALPVGTRIDTINGGTLREHRATIQKDFFPASAPEREDWNELMTMANAIGLEDGSVFTLRHYAPRSPAAGSVRFEGDAAIIRPGPFDGSGALTQRLKQYRARMKDCSRLVWDLRDTAGRDESELGELLRYVVGQDTHAGALFGATDVYVNYSELNCRVKTALLPDTPESESWRRLLRENSGKGFIRETDSAEGEPVVSYGMPQSILLLDMDCRFAGEVFAAAAMRAGAVSIGRETAGTLGYTADVRVQLDDRYILTWPTAVSAEVRDNALTPGIGLQPALAHPWVPEECARDLLMEEALQIAL